MRDITIPTVWAPNAGLVDLVLDDGREVMAAIGGGWWASRRLVPGTRYRFSIDGNPPLPDPRSLAQPEGPHGPSVVVDPEVFTGRVEFSIDLRGKVLYELHVGAFTPEGTFDAACEHLDHLVELGIEAVEVMPVADFPGLRGWGYDGVGQYAVHRSYGGPESFARFIDECHLRGLGVVLDVVHNHQGPEGNYLAQFGPYFTSAHGTPWGEAVNLDQAHSRDVRDFLLGACRQWLVDYRVDGLRLDAVHELRDDSPKHYLAELSETVREWEVETGRKLTLFAESDLNQPSMVAPVDSVPGAKGMDAQWADDVHHALHAFFTGETSGYYVDFGTAEALKQALTRVFIHEGGWSTFRDRNWGAPVDVGSELYDGHSFLCCLQNHDQVGNRAIGDRTAQMAKVPAAPQGSTALDTHRPTAATADPVEQALGLQAGAAALYLLSAFTPMLFMGEEWAASTPFPFFSDLGPELGPHVTAGRRREFEKMSWEVEVPDPQDPATLRSAVLRWDELDRPPHDRMLAWYTALLRIRREHGDLRNGSLHSVTVDVVSDDAVLMRRGKFAVAASRSGGEVEFALPGEVVLSWTPPVQTATGLRVSGPGALIVRTR